MPTVKQLLQAKGNTVWFVSPEASVYAALELMAEKDVGALLVMTSGQVVGIFSERDYARKIVLKGKASRDTLVREVMTDRVVFVRAEQTIPDCMALMTNQRVRHLPVFEGDQLLGVISIGDVVKSIMDEQEFTIEQLENYIMGVR